MKDIYILDSVSASGIGNTWQEQKNYLNNSSSSIALLPETSPYHYLESPSFCSILQKTAENTQLLLCQTNRLLDFYESHDLPATARWGIFAGTTGGLSFDEEVHFCAHHSVSNNDLSLPQFQSDGNSKILDIIDDALNTKLKTRSDQKITFVSACTSSQIALNYACQLIQVGLIDNALVAGIDRVQLNTVYGFRSLLIYDETPCKPFDKMRNGLNLGDGCAMVLLSRFTPPSKHKFNICGFASFNHLASLTAPDPTGVIGEKVIFNALQIAKIGKTEIKGVKAHGTATLDNDFAEATTLKSLFQMSKNSPDFVSLKGYIGHTLGASGTVELDLFTKSILDGFLPKTVGFFEPHSETPWFAPTIQKVAAQEGYYLLNSLGFGGSYAATIFKFTH